MKTMKFNHKGVTLMEMLVVVAIIGMLAVASLPNIPPIIAANRLRTSANDLVSKLRGVRGIAISKARAIEIVLNLTDQNFVAWQLQHNEYNLLDEEATTGKDLNLTLATGGSADTFLVFTEDKQQLHLLRRWNSSGTPIYEVPINYVLKDGFRSGNNGVASMTMTLADGTTLTPPKLTVYPSGLFEPNVIITLKGPQKYHTQYIINVYKGGQIASRREGY
jgi:prepilin-type N-terminal cleavage/methylation domain-containing protein